MTFIGFISVFESFTQGVLSGEYQRNHFCHDKQLGRFFELTISFANNIIGMSQWTFKQNY